jgi:hypothetical protein
MLLRKKKVLLLFLIVSLFPNFLDCFFSSQAETESQLLRFPLAMSVEISFFAFISVGRSNAFLWADG